jgi:hypothetical protein
MGPAIFGPVGIKTQRWNWAIGAVCLCLGQTLSAKEGHYPGAAAARSGSTGSLWDSFFEVRSGPGYKDNALLAHQGAEGSALVASGLEWTLNRVTRAPRRFNFYLALDDIRYFNVQEMDKEQTALALATWDVTLSPRWQAGLELRYFYLNQVMDASLTEAELGTLRVRGHALAGRPSLRLNLAGGNWLQIEFELARQFFDRPLDDYWDGGPKLTLGRRYGHQSEVSVGLGARERSYDLRRTLDRDGAGGSDARDLEFLAQEASAVWRHHWDSRRHWRTTTKAGLKRSTDNGSGYFDYTTCSVSEQVRYRGSTVEISGLGSVRYYDYPVQRVGGGNTALKHKTLLVLNLRAEKPMKKRWRLYAEFEHERSISNELVDDYQANTVTSGVSYEF